MKEFDYKTVKNHKTAVLLKPLFYVLSRIFFKIRCVGRENIPNEGGFILAANHISAPDPVFVYTSIKRPIHFMNKQENFEKGLFRWLYIHFNAFPVNRGGADKSAIEYSVKILNSGQILGIFPEGTRSKDYTPQSAKAGVALIAREAKADVLPVSVYADNRAKPFSKITIRFGELMPYESLGFTGSGRSDELKTVARNIMERITAQWEEGHCK